MALDLHRLNTARKSEKSQEEILKEIITDEFPLNPLEVIGEKSFDDPEAVKEANKLTGTDVQEFYRDATVFLTGGTGFMGKMIIEKLCRSCPHIKQIYLLVRNKKGKVINERVDAIFDDRLFMRLKHEQPKFHHKISAFAGDVSLPGLGLSASDRQKLIEEVNIMFHAAATIRFDEHIRVAIDINVLGTREMLKLAKETINLKSFMYVSTAYANCPNKTINEKFYEPPYDYNGVISLVSSAKDDSKLESLTPSLTSGWPNTYTFTKALAEDLVRKEAEGLPLGIFRPSVVISTYKEPVRGWIDNVYGPIGMIVGAGTGVLHTFQCNVNQVLDMVPVDLAVNALICAAYKVGKKNQPQQTIDNEPTIFNYVSSSQNPILLGDFFEIIKKHGIPTWVTINAIWFYSFIPTTNVYLYSLLFLLLHTIPGYLFDLLAKITRRKPILGKIYQKTKKASEALVFFAHRQWDFRNDNTQALWSELSESDKDKFFFDMNTMSWDYYARACALGLRLYLVKDDINTLKAARKKWKKLYVAHILLKTIVTIAFLRILWFAIRLIS
ncbi:fatty acyl-CoA reductase wat-like isoform X3 [Daktulosphaira vitifoliae]|uniref:fatty acyl-CoA reductase wat-like isoform X3 n=1 Tax=Daktulosphaira vitifoliae TaxID=58002 RepID=UPI0021AA55C8|nr:fatty acyl-CoA reductase wat-like isoform X3 [Daktulosphaira vitifoliae]XP_050540838.1 fatty acyl-CoA reductase wat-like isoform X3 [Daktulosphaira vitifoliae]